MVGDGYQNFLGQVTVKLLGVLQHIEQGSPLTGVTGRDG